MLLRRVLVTTALVAVLVSSLFSGWLTASSSILKPPVARAADDPIVTACSGAKDNGKIINDRASFAFSTDPQGLYSISIYMESLPASRLDLEGKLYRKPVGQQSYADAGNILFGKLTGVNSSNTSVDKWSHSKLVTGASSGDSFIAIIQSPSDAGAISKCYKSSDTGNSATGGTIITNETAKEWFGSIDDVTLKIIISQNKAAPPYVLVEGAGSRPTIKFILDAVSGEGAIVWETQEWFTYKAVRQDTNKEIDNLVFAHNDENDEYFFWASDRDPVEGVRKGKFNETIGDPELTDSNINELLNYTFNVPKDDSNTCGNSVFHIVGPKKDDNTGTPKPDYETVAEAGYTRDPSALAQNCLNIQENGWLQYWGIEHLFSADPGSECGFNTLLRDGVGPAIVKIFACVIQNIIDGIYTPLSQITQGAGNETGVLECNLAADGNKIPPGCSALPNPQFVNAWKFSLGLINVVVILALLAIAFANILHLNINTYAAKKALPGLIIGVVGANASLLLIRFVLDVAKSLAVFAFNIVGAGTAGEFVGKFMNAIGMTAFENKTINFVAVAAFPLTFIILLIFAIYMLYLTVVFAWGMVKRLVYIYGLTVLAPVAFVMYGVPGQQQLFTKWWDMILRQIFMLPLVFIAAAMLIKYTTVTVQPPNSNLGPADISNLVNMALVFLTATAILKLPGLITKGAIDISGAAKKAFGMAKATPLRAVSSYQGGHEFFKGGGKQRLSAGFYRKLGLKDLAKNRADTARENRLGYKKKYKGSLSWIKGARGYAKLIEDPNILLESYQERVKQSQKDDKIAALTRTHRIPGKIRGGPAEALLQKGLAREEMKDATDMADYGDWNTGLGGGHLDAVYGKERKNIPDGVWKAILDVAGGNEEAAEAIRRRMGALGSEEAVLNFIEKDVKDGGLGISNQWDIADLMKAVGYESRLTEGANRVRLPEGATHGMTIAAVALMRRKMVDPDGDRAASSWTPPAGGGGGANPSGGANPPNTRPGGGGGGNPSGGSGGGGGGAPGGKVQKVFVTNPVQIQNPQNEALASRLAQVAEKIKLEVGDTDLNTHVDTVLKGGDVFAGDVGKVLEREFGAFLGSSGGELVKHAISAYASGGGGLDSIRQKIATGEIVHQSNNELGSRSDELLERIANKLETGGASDTDFKAAAQEMAGVLVPHIQKLGGSPELSQAYADRLLGGFKQVLREALTGKKGLSKELRDSWKETLGTFATNFAQENGIDHVSNESLAKAIGERQTQPAPAPTVPPVTKDPLPADGSSTVDTSQNPEPPITGS